jgi:hypothetical protein
MKKRNVKGLMKINLKVPANTGAYESDVRFAHDTMLLLAQFIKDKFKGLGIDHLLDGIEIYITEEE